MDSQVRNFRDFLLLFNKLSEMCFNHCTDNFYTRTSTEAETACIDNCVQKFSAVNQKIMGIYVEAQTAINQRRLAEFEAQVQQQQQAAEIAKLQQEVAGTSTDMSTSAETATAKASTLV